MHMSGLTGADKQTGGGRFVLKHSQSSSFVSAAAGAAAAAALTASMIASSVRAPSYLHR